MFCFVLATVQQNEKNKGNIKFQKAKHIFYFTVMLFLQL